MTETPEYFPNRIERIEQILLGLVERQANTQEQLEVVLKVVGCIYRHLKIPPTPLFKGG